jgi:Chagasin family peptidase inhibitor I42
VKKRAMFGFLLMLMLTLVLSLLTSIAPGKIMLLDETDNHTHVVLYVGDSLSIKLKSNPTTGYSWSVAELPVFLQQLDSKTEPGKGGVPVRPGSNTSHSRQNFPASRRLC